MQKKTIEESDLYRLIIENVNDLISVFDKDLKLIYINDISQKISGFSKEEVMNKTPMDFLHPDDIKRSRKLVKEMLKTGFGGGEFRMRRKDNSYVWFEVNAKKIVDKNGDINFVLISRDITERKLLDQKLKESEQKYREAYNRASLYKDLFAHDMNNVLHNIHSGMELSSHYLNSPDALKKIKELHEIVEEQVAKGAKMISNIQKLSELEEFKTPLRLIKPNKILNEAIKYIYSSFQTRKIDIQIDAIDEDIIIQANDLLTDVFENLLINAVKYNDNPIIEIIIQISKVKKNDRNYHKFEFIDNGIGVEDFKKKLIFQRGQLKEKGIKGMGLGLSVVKRILDSYKGEIWVEDKVKGDYSKGSNFIMLIPEVA